MRRQLELLSQAEAPVVAVDLEKGDHVRVKEGSFMGVDGTVEDVFAERGLVRVMIPFCGRSTPIDLALWMVERSEA